MSSLRNAAQISLPATTAYPTGMIVCGIQIGTPPGSTCVDCISATVVSHAPHASTNVAEAAMAMTTMLAGLSIFLGRTLTP